MIAEKGVIFTTKIIQCRNKLRNCIIVYKIVLYPISPMCMHDVLNVDFSALNVIV